jgi:hypothetical protein
MDQSEILAIMIAAPEIGIPDWDFVLADYAEQLAGVAPKLTEEELYGLMTIGAAMYQLQCVQTDAEKQTARTLLNLAKRGRE